MSAGVVEPLPVSNYRVVCPPSPESLAKERAELRAIILAAFAKGPLSPSSDKWRRMGICLRTVGAEFLLSQGLRRSSSVARIISTVIEGDVVFLRRVITSLGTYYKIN